MARMGRFLGHLSDLGTGSHLGASLTLVVVVVAYFEWWKEVRPQAVNDGDPTSRLPFRPDLYYQKDDWQGWEVWSVGTSLAAADGALDATSHQ